MSKYKINNLNLNYFIYFNSKNSGPNYKKDVIDNHANLKYIKTLVSNIIDFITYDDQAIHTTLTNYIYSFIANSNFLCPGLNSEYIKDAFQSSDAILVISPDANPLPNGNIFGFAVLKYNEPRNALNVDIICSHVGIKGVGRLLLNAVQQIAYINFFTLIYLQSVKSAISFYEQFGFIKKNSSCGNMCWMTLSIEMPMVDGGRKRVHKRLNKNKSKCKTKRRRKRTNKTRSRRRCNGATRRKGKRRLK